MKIVAAGPKIFALRHNKVYAYRVGYNFSAWDVVGTFPEVILDLAVTHSRVDDTDVFEVFVVDSAQQIWSLADGYGAEWTKITSP